MNIVVSTIKHNKIDQNMSPRLNQYLGPRLGSISGPSTLGNIIGPDLDTILGSIEDSFWHCSHSPSER